MRLSTFTLIAAVGFFVAGLQFAMGQPSNSYVAKGDLIVRDSPPKGWLYYPGNQVGVLRKEQEVVVEDQRQIKDLFVEQEWLKISKGKLAGWVYNGTTAKGERYLVPSVVSALSSDSPRTTTYQTRPLVGCLGRALCDVFSRDIHPKARLSRCQRTVYAVPASSWHPCMPHRCFPSDLYGSGSIHKQLSFIFVHDWRYHGTRNGSP